jgi:hypothetical protein
MVIAVSAENYDKILAAGDFIKLMNGQVVMDELLSMVIQRAGDEGTIDRFLEHLAVMATVNNVVGRKSN